MLVWFACAAALPMVAQPQAVQVTATRIATPVSETPASVSIVSGEELSTRGAVDLRTALSGLAGVEISPGGDSGPASSVPALWGLREFDAYLLVVDGVPWGGAFNPTATALDLHNVERIEVLRGSAPVTYGATSFVGVIQVIHKDAGSFGKHLSASLGAVDERAENVSAAFATDLPRWRGWRHSISSDIERQRFADVRAGVERGHVLYRASAESAIGQLRFDVDVNLLRQEPTSPYPGVSDGLDPSIDTDANFHPADARIDQNRFHMTAALDRAFGESSWNSTLALTRTEGDVVRGFLAESCANAPLAAADNACGADQDVEISDLYFDSHVQSRLSGGASLTWGFDMLMGKGKQEARVFAYAVDPLHGNDAARSNGNPVLEENDAEDERNFSGLYGQVAWDVGKRIHVLAGGRLNYTREIREGEEDLPTGPEPARNSRTEARPSGFVGGTWEMWGRGNDRVTLYADYRNTYKPAAIDFGPEAEADILKPEDAESWEVGMETAGFDGRLAIDVSFFNMTMDNLVVPQSNGGSPGLANAGTLHLKGSELAVNWRATEAATLHVAYAHHESRFGDYVRDFDGVPVQLRGNSLELSPEETGSAGIRWAGRSGLTLSVDYAYTGKRYLNKRNTSLAEAFGVLDATAAYRFANGWELRLAGYNLSDSRDPVSESELGDGQYYRMPARNVSLIASLDFR